MEPHDTLDYERVIGGNLLGPDDEAIGTVDEIYYDDDSGAPKWGVVRTGFFGNNITFFPLERATQTEAGLHIPFTKEQLKVAPNVEADQEINHDEEEKLFAYYRGLGYDTPVDDEDHDHDQVPDHAPDVDHEPTAVPAVATTDSDHNANVPDTDTAMTRSEEELHVGTETHEVGRVRLRKYIVTEHVQQTIPVQKEVVRLEREPITSENAAAANSGAELTEEEHEVVLHEQRPVVQKEVVAKERVRLEKDVVTEDHTVEGEVRREVIEEDSDGEAPAPR